MKIFHKKSTANKKILVVRYRSVGDTIYALPFLRELRKNYPPETIIDFVNEDGTKFIIEKSNCVNNIYSPANFKFTKPYNLSQLFKMLKFLKSYDKIYFLSNTKSITKYAFLAGAKERIGLGFKENKFLTKKIEYDNNKPVIDLYLDVLKQDGLQVWDNQYDNIFSDLEPYENTFKGEYVTIQAYSRSKMKDWQDEKWKNVIEYITNNLHLNVVLLGGPKHFDKYNDFTQNMPNVYNLAGKTTMKESIQIIKDAKLHLGVDSGLMHVAAVMKKPSVLIHGTTSMLHWGPRNENCSIVSKNYSCSPCFIIINKKSRCCGKIPKCIWEISPDEVISVINKKLGLIKV